MVIEGETNIDSAIEATKIIDNALNQVKTNIQNIKNQLKEKEQELQRYKTEIENLNKKITEQKQELETAKQKSSRSEEMEKENIEMKKELQGIQEQLSKISSMYSELSKKEEEAIDVRELLTIYVTLLEQVFAGLPHAKVLWLLHGAKKQFNRDELTKTSGFQPAIVLKSIYDLQQAKLVQYDMNSQDVKLMRKLY